MSDSTTGRARSAAWRLLLAAVASMPVFSFFVTPGSLAAKSLVAAVFAGAAWRPADAWLAVATLAPIGALLAVWMRATPSLAEPVVWAFIGGWLIHETARAAAGRPSPARPDRAALTLAVLLGVTVLAALLVRLTVHQFAVDFPVAYVRGLFRFVSEGYFAGPSRYRASVAPAFRMLAGLAVFAATLVLARRHPRLLIRGARALVVGAGLAALASAAQVVWTVISAGTSAAFPKGPFRLRLTSVGPDVNAAGSFYALALGASAGLAMADRRLRSIWAGACALILGALWLTGSRTALAAPAVAATLVAGHAWFHRRSRQLAVAAGVALALTLLFGAYLLLTVNVRTDAGVALDWRIEHGTRALRAFAEHPIFGVGMGRFYSVSPRYTSSGWTGRNNAHNMFLQVLAELGVVGLGLLVALVWRVWRTGNAQRSGTLVTCLAAGILAHVVTWLAGHPLLIFEAAVPFWLALGLVAGASRTGPADDTEPPPETLERPPERTRSSWSWWRRALPWLCALALLCSVYPRSRAEIRNADLSRAVVGFSARRVDARGERFRWMGTRARLFVPATVSRVAIAFRSPRAPAAIKVFVNDRLVARLVAHKRWTDAVFELPDEDAARFVPVELHAAMTPAIDGPDRGTIPADRRVQINVPRILR